MDTAAITQVYLMYVILPLWLLVGIADWLCHRASHIETTSGAKESLIHLLMLGEVGIKVNIKNLEIATAREQRSAGTYDLFYSGWAHMPHDPDWYFGQWFTKAGAAKLTRYDNPRVEQLIAEGRVPDPKVRQAKYEELERILWEEEPEIWLCYTVAIYGVSDRLRNFEARRDYYVLLSDVSIA